MQRDVALLADGLQGAGQRIRRQERLLVLQQVTGEPVALQVAEDEDLGVTLHHGLPADRRPVLVEIGERVARAHRGGEQVRRAEAAGDVRALGVGEPERHRDVALPDPGGRGVGALLQLRDERLPTRGDVEDRGELPDLLVERVDGERDGARAAAVDAHAVLAVGRREVGGDPGLVEACALGHAAGGEVPPEGRRDEVGVGTEHGLVARGVVRQPRHGPVGLGELRQDRVGPGGGAHDPVAEVEGEEDLRRPLVEGDDPLRDGVEGQLLPAVVDHERVLGGALAPAGRALLRHRLGGPARGEGARSDDGDSSAADPAVGRSHAGWFPCQWSGRAAPTGGTATGRARRAPDVRD